jgi:hypothetical protein
MFAKWQMVSAVKPVENKLSSLIYFSITRDTEISPLFYEMQGLVKKY